MKGLIMKSLNITSLDNRFDRAFVQTLDAIYTIAWVVYETATNVSIMFSKTSVDNRGNQFIETKNDVIDKKNITKFYYRKNN
jgi:hypothetical protein